MKLPHGRDLRRAESTAKSLRQILGKFTDHFFTVARAFLPRLLMLHNPPANFPIRRRHQRVDDAGGGPARCIQQLDHTGQYVAVVSRLGLKRWAGFLVAARFAHGAFRHWLLFAGWQSAGRAIWLVAGSAMKTTR